MDIAITITDITGDGGTERTSVLLANTFLKKGCNVTIISIFKKNSKISYPLESGVKVVYLTNQTYTLRLPKSERLKLLLKARSTLKKILKNNHFDEIIAQAFLPTFLFFSIRQANKITACEHFKYDIYGKIGIAIRNFVYKKCRRVITLTTNDSQKFISAGVENFVVPNMVSFPIGENYGADKKLIVTAGRLSDQKGFDLLIEAMKPVFNKYPDWSLEIYGKGEKELELRELVKINKLENNIIFKGFSNNLAQVFRDSTFYVLSSRYEGFPMILLEAVSQNLPCVSFNCPEGPSEILRNDGGELVSPEDVKELSEAIIRFIEDRDLRKSCAEQALRNIEDYSPENIYNKWIAVFSHGK